MTAGADWPGQPQKTRLLRQGPVFSAPKAHIAGCFRAAVPSDNDSPGDRVGYAWRIATMVAGVQPKTVCKRETSCYCWAWLQPLGSQRLRLFGDGAGFRQFPGNQCALMRLYPPRTGPPQFRTWMYYCVAASRAICRWPRSTCTVSERCSK